MKEFNEDRTDDFDIIYSAEPDEVAQFAPSILYIDQNAAEIPELAWSTVTPGGIVIFPENTEVNSANFFRKIPFSESNIQDTSRGKVLITDDMDIPLQMTDPQLINNLQGLAQLSQATAILQEDFWEAVTEYQEEK